MPSLVVIGSQWGDEGKGKIVDVLTSEADWVVRFQGGNNAGHTLVVDGVKTTLRLLPSGVLRADTKCLIGAGVVVNPSVLLQEISTLEAVGHSVRPGRLLLDRDAHLVLDYHAVVDRERERLRGASKIGTTGQGIGPAYEDRWARVGIRFAELANLERLKERVRCNVEEKNLLLQHVLKSSLQVDFNSVWEKLREEATLLQPYVGNGSLTLFNALKRGEKVVFEGAQGVMLDGIHGTYPFVTSSHTIAGAALTGVGLGPRAVDYVLGVAKAYATRVGEGPFPSEMGSPLGEEIRNRGHEFGSVTGRPRRCGWFDAVAMRRAARLSGFDSLVLTKLDVLSGLSPLQICVGYRLDGQELDDVPAMSEDIARVEPVLIDVSGWMSDVSGARSYSDLPKEAQNYLTTIGELVGCPVSIVSVGPEREATLLTADAAPLQHFIR